MGKYFVVLWKKSIMSVEFSHRNGKIKISVGSFSDQIKKVVAFLRSYPIEIKTNCFLWEDLQTCLKKLVSFFEKIPIEAS